MSKLTMKGIKCSYETRAVRTEATNELLPCGTSVGKDNDTTHELPCVLDLLLSDASRLVCAEAYAVYVLQCLPGIHPDELANITPNEGRKAESGG